MPTPKKGGKAEGKVAVKNDSQGNVVSVKETVTKVTTFEKGKGPKVVPRKKGTSVPPAADPQGVADPVQQVATAAPIPANPHQQDGDSLLKTLTKLFGFVPALMWMLFVLGGFACVYLGVLIYHSANSTPASAVTETTNEKPGKTQASETPHSKEQLQIANQMAMGSCVIASFNEKKKSVDYYGEAAVKAGEAAALKEAITTLKDQHGDALKHAEQIQQEANRHVETMADKFLKAGERKASVQVLSPPAPPVPPPPKAEKPEVAPPKKPNLDQKIEQGFGKVGHRLEVIEGDIRDLKGRMQKVEDKTTSPQSSAGPGIQSGPAVASVTVVTPASHVPINQNDKSCVSALVVKDNGDIGRLWVQSNSIRQEGDIVSFRTMINDEEYQYPLSRVGFGQPFPFNSRPSFFEFELNPQTLVRTCNEFIYKVGSTIYCADEQGAVYSSDGTVYH